MDDLSAVISVELHGGRDKDKATAFHVENGYLSLWHHDRLVLKHRLQQDPYPPRFWSNESDGPRALRWNITIEIERNGAVHMDRPLYGFRNQQIYETFQSQIRNASFVNEFVADSIRPVGGRNSSLHISYDCNVKVWERNDKGVKTGNITIPFHAPHHEMVNEVLECAWLDLKRGVSRQAHEMHIKFKSQRPRSSSHANHNRTPSSGSEATGPLARLRRLNFTRTSTFGSTRTGDNAITDDTIGSPTNELTPAEIVRPEVLQKFTEIVISFKDKTQCLYFEEVVQPYTIPPSSQFDTSADDPTSPPSRPSSHGASPASTATRSSRRVTDTPSTVGTTAPPTRQIGPSPPLRSGDIPELQPLLPSPNIVSQHRPSETRHTRPSVTAADILNIPDSRSNSIVSTAPSYISRDTNPHRDSRSTSISDRPGSGTTPAGLFGMSNQTTPGNDNTPLSVPTPAIRTPASDIGPYKPPGSPSLNPQQVREEQMKFWQRQENVAPISQSARIRAQENKDFYDVPLVAQAELRLIHIRPGRAGDLELWLESKTLEDAAGTYEALSYSWGAGTELRDVVLENGQKRDKKFKVSLHLEQALRRLRLIDAERIVWIDAICIDQSNVKEMNHQVPLMGMIYQKAKRTIIWIAEFEETENEPTCRRTFPAEDDTPDSRTLCARFDGTALEHGDLDTKLKAMLENFHTRLQASGSGDAWYLRLWCVQEFYFSDKLPSVYLGQHAIGWNHFASIFKEVVGEYGPISLFAQLRSSANAQMNTMHELCSQTGAFRVSDPRDRIYSLLNMTRDHAAKVTPDYAKSTLEVLQEVTDYLIQECNSIDVLLDKRYDRTFGDGFGLDVLPSFMPDLTQLQTLEMSTGKDKYHTGGENSSPIFELCVDDEPPQLQRDFPGVKFRVLYLKAIKFDRIKYFTTVDDIPAHETSPSGALIYNSRRAPGTVIKSILDALHYDFDPPKHREIDRSPKIGRLMLEFLFEEKRNHIDELKRCTDRSGKSLKMMFKKQLDTDIKYVEAEAEDVPLEQQAVEEDVLDIQRYWEKRMTYIRDNAKGSLDVKKALEVPDAPWDQAIQDDASIEKDFQAAVEFENLYCYARRTHNRYYFSGYDYHQPMRRNVLDAQDPQDIPELETEFEHLEELELHEYSDKARQRDFFRTISGFVGLGPTGMRENDLIVVPYGASRPFILRKTPNEDESYTLVGECVMPGIMHGQWLPGREKYDRYYKLR